MAVKYDPILHKKRESDEGVGSLTVSEYENAEPASPSSGDIWVKKKFTVTGGPMGLLLALTYAGDGEVTYELSYKNAAADIVRVVLA
jgi:hypothetical protein